MNEAATANNGQLLNSRYVLRERLGVGGQGEVWRAFDPQSGADIALKILHPSAGRSAAGSFFRSAIAGAGMGIVGVTSKSTSAKKS